MKYVNPKVTTNKSQQLLKFCFDLLNSKDFSRRVILQADDSWKTSYR